MRASPHTLRLPLAAPASLDGGDLAAMSRGVLAVLECPDVESAAVQILLACRTLIRAPQGRLALISADGAGRWIAGIGPKAPPRTRSPRQVRPTTGPARLAELAGAGIAWDSPRRVRPAIPLPRGCAGWRSALAVPMATGGTVNGVLLLGDKPKGFTARDLVVASTFAALAAAAHERCDVSDSLERRIAASGRELSRANRALRRQVAVLDEVRSSLRREQSFRTSVENSLPTGIMASDPDGRILHVNRALVRLLGFPRRELIGVGLPHPFWPPEKSKDYEKGFRALGSGPLPRGGFRRRFLRRSGEPIDVLLMVSPLRGADHTTTGWVASVQDITGQLRTEAALRRSADQLRLVSARLIDAEERERKRIARELHDSLGQTLTALRYRIEDALGECRRCPEAPSGAQQRLQEAVGILGDAAEEVHNIVSDLRPAILDDLGLASAIRWFCRDFEGANPGISCRVSLGPRDGAVPEHLKTVIFRLVQEGLTNISRHSRARNAKVQLVLLPDRVELMIDDDGRGIRRGTASRGAGIPGMRERVELSGGSFSLGTGPGSGTRIRAVWPLAEPS